MRRLLAVFALSLAVMAPVSECTDFTQMKVEITEQPKGGNMVNEVTCTFNVTNYYNNDEEKSEGRELDVIWMTKNKEHKSESFTIKDDGKDGLTVSFSAPAGQYLDKTFWVKFESTANISGDLESDKADCTVN